MELNTLKNKIILFANDLWIIDDIYADRLLMSKLESDSEIVEFDINEDFNDFDFEQARLKAVDVMNQTRYFDNVLVKEKDNRII